MDTTHILWETKLHRLSYVPSLFVFNIQVFSQFYVMWPAFGNLCNFVNTLPTFPVLG